LIEFWQILKSATILILVPLLAGAAWQSPAAKLPSVFEQLTSGREGVSMLLQICGLAGLIAFVTWMAFVSAPGAPFMLIMGMSMALSSKQ